MCGQEKKNNGGKFKRLLNWWEYFVHCSVSFPMKLHSAVEGALTQGGLWMRMGRPLPSDRKGKQSLATQCLHLCITVALWCRFTWNQTFPPFLKKNICSQIYLKEDHPFRDWLIWFSVSVKKLQQTSGSYIWMYRFPSPLFRLDICCQIPASLH